MIIVCTIIYLISSAACHKLEASPVDSVCNDHARYVNISTHMINASSYAYVAYSRGNLSYVNAERQAMRMFYDFKELGCTNYPEHDLVLLALQSTRYAIGAEYWQHYRIVNLYIDRAFNALRELNTVHGWEV